MLSKITLKEIELKFGQEIRYPTDCESLSGHISMITLQHSKGYLVLLRELKSLGYLHLIF